MKKNNNNNKNDEYMNDMKEQMHAHKKYIYHYILWLTLLFLNNNNIKLCWFHFIHIRSICRFIQDIR